MKLESLTMEIRPRTPWEAMDVAVRLAVTHWRLLFSAWMVTVFPLFVIINLILLEDYPIWAFAVLWFLKPLYDRVPLYVLSRVIFSEKTNWQDVVSAVPSFFKTGLFSSLTLYRLDAGRAFGLPVRQLEGLKGKLRRQRMQTLGRAYNNREVLFFILCFHLESFLSWGLIGLLLMLLPTEIALQVAENVFLSGEPTLLVNSLSILYYFFVMMVVETLYVSGGFVLYLNRRTILEGWDIELIFRKLSKKQSKQQSSSRGRTAGILPMIIFTLFCSSALFFCSGGVHEAQALSQNASTAYEKILPPIAPQRLDSELSSKTIKEVMKSPVFNRFKQVETFEYTGEEDDIDEKRSWWAEKFVSIGKAIAFIFEVALWVIAIIILFLIVKYREALQLGLGRLFKTKEKISSAPEMLFGLDVREESLPDDVATEALDLYKQQNYRAALALLYRATLAYLVKNDDFNLAQGATEGDCLEWLRKKRAGSRNDEVKYFVDLTKAWQLTAYAHRFIPEKEMKNLCLQWPHFFSSSATLPSKAHHENKTDGASDE